MMRLKSPLFAAVALLVAPHAAATILSFDDLPSRAGTGSQSVGSSYSSDGYEVIGGPGFSSFPPNPSFFVFDTGRLEWTGTPGLTLFSVGGRIELRRADSSVFDIESIDVARGDLNHVFGLDVPMSFTGAKADGTFVSALFSLSGPPGQNTTFTFSDDFSGLTSLVWFQGAFWHQFDNIQVSSPIPEPEMYALLLTALGMLGFAARRRENLRPRKSLRDRTPTWRSLRFRNQEFLTEA